MKLSTRTLSLLNAWAAESTPCIIPLSEYNPTYEECKHHRADGHVYVFEGGADPVNTIFSCKRDIWVYRAWHDTLHIDLDIPFGGDHEYRLAYEQEQAALAMGISQADADLLRLDLELHITHYNKFKEHPEYQTDLIRMYLATGEITYQGVRYERMA